MVETSAKSTRRGSGAAGKTGAAKTTGRRTKTAGAGAGSTDTPRKTRTTGAGTEAGAGVKNRGGRKPRTMSEEHRNALQSGRAQTRTVRAYLEALENRRPRRGPRPNLAKMQERITAIGAMLETTGPLERVSLHQERLDLERQLEALEQGHRFEELEEAFISVAGEYSQRRGISAEAWLAVGVSKAVLKRAGVA